MDMMRRNDRKQDDDFAHKVLKAAEYCILSMVDRDGNPYAIPMSFVFDGNDIYLHGANEGKKLRVLQGNPQVCLTCVGRTKVLPDQFSTEYESVIVKGTAKIIDEPHLKREGLLKLAEKYSAEYSVEAVAYIERVLKETTVIRISIDSMTAKAKLTRCHT